MTDKYAEYFIKDPDTKQDVFNAINEYNTLTKEQQREWRNEWLPKMHQVAIWNFYWKVLRPLEDQLGADTVSQEIDMDIPMLENQLKQAQIELEDAKLKHSQMLESKQKKTEAQKQLGDEIAANSSKQDSLSKIDQVAQEELNE